ncbi:MAG TPA: tripartite tricarboxylate transporter substrate binding protein [Hyphomicrobiaceae bacterium]|nr:tripartite tricarboxylate transporter substrate binding protein [Hyphomicrobiaceae bacterium]
MLKGMLAGLSTAAAMLVALGTGAAAQDKWPSKPVTVIVPFAAGGNTDVMARIFAEHLSKKFGQQFVIENKAGAGGVTGLNATAKAPPDGYTIAVATSGGIAINPILTKDKIPYNVEKDFTYLYGMAAMPNIFIVNPSVPAKTMAELIAWLKANPGTPYATSGIGTTQHICGEMLALKAGVKINPVAYRASNQSLQDLIGGQINLACDNFAAAWEQVKSGKLRAVSITSLEPYPLAKDVEITAKSLPGFEIMPAFGWVGPAGIPADISKSLIDALVEVGKIPSVREAMEKFGVLQTEQAGKAYEDALKKERAAYQDVIEKAGIKVQ